MRTPTRLSLLALAFASVSAHAQFYKTDEFLFSINNGGKAAGSGGSGHVTWTALGGIVDIGGSTDAGTATISADGRYVGATAVNSATGLSEAARYDSVSGTWTTLGGFGSSSGSNSSSGWGMSADGSTIVGLGWVDAGHAHAMSITGTTVTDLGTNVPGNNSRAQAVSADGSVVGGWDDSDGGFWQGSIWKNGVQTLLTDSSGVAVGEVGVISGDGNWAFGGSTIDDKAYRWSEATGVETFDNPFGTPMIALGSSYDGSVVVGSAGSFFSGYETWIWTSATGVRNLEDIAAVLPGYDGTQLRSALGVSPDGRYVVGIYSNFIGFPGGGFAMDLQAVPEPCTMLALGGLAALALRRKRAVK